MFVLQSEPRWTWPVVVKAPDAEGNLVEQRFSAVWRLLPKDERERLGATLEGTDELLRRSIVEVSDVLDQDKQPMPHSAALVDALIAIPWVRAGLVLAYAQSLEGVPPEAARGN